LIRSDLNTKTKLPLLQGSESTGANSIAAWDPAHLIICGGNFLADRDTTANCFLSTDGGENWIRPTRPPFGYRSCVIYISRDTLLACGTSGVDLSVDGGMNWTLISSESFHVCQSAKKGKAVFLAGSNGRIARLEGLIYKN
jgi:outer membrane protein assembly factor BamB